jgi:hypothetical protein
VAYIQVPPLAGSRDETMRGQGIRKRSVSWNLPTCRHGRGEIHKHARAGRKVKKHSQTHNPSAVFLCRYSPVVYVFKENSTELMKMSKKFRT